MNKILTIVVPTYNMEKYLDRCLNSLIAPDKGYRNQVEVIVVIDGATDKSSAIAHAYEEKYPDIFNVIDKENGHYGSCINAALKVASGKYIKLVDADDYLDSTKLNVFLSKLLTSEADVILTGYRTVDDVGQETSTFTRELKYGSLIEWVDVVESLCNDRHLAMHEVAYKTSILKDSNYKQTEGIAYTDQEWIFYPMQYVKSFVSLDIVLYNYLLGREGQSMSPEIFKRSIPAQLQIARRMIEQALPNPDKPQIRQYTLNNALWLIESIYTLFLLSVKLDDEREYLMEFDQFLKNKNVQIYDLLNSCKTKYSLFTISHILLWRRKRYKKPIILKILSFLKSLHY